jgi:hypothetical protein
MTSQPDSGSDSGTTPDAASVLIERLEATSRDLSTQFPGSYVREVVDQAADLIKTLLAEVSALRELAYAPDGQEHRALYFKAVAVSPTPAWLPVESGAVLAEIAEERRRQIDVHGWSPEHDDGHTAGEIANAAADFAQPGQRPITTSWAFVVKVIDKEPRRVQLIKAAALIVAEIERLDRASQPLPPPPSLIGGNSRRWRGFTPARSSSPRRSTAPTLRSGSATTAPKSAPVVALAGSRRRRQLRLRGVGRGQP